MRKFQQAFLVVCALAMFSCHSATSPREYNNLITDLHEQNWRYLDSVETLLLTMEQRDTALSNAICDDMYHHLDSLYLMLGKMERPWEARKFHATAQELVLFLRDSMVPAFRHATLYEPQSVEWYDSWYAIDELVSGKASKIEDRLIEEQAEFAKQISINY